MSRPELAFMSAAEAGRRFRAGTLTPLELVQDLAERTHEQDGLLRSTITLAFESAVHGAEAAGAEIRRGEWPGPLHGIPFGVKDCIATAGIRTTANSRLLAGRVPSRDAPSVTALRRSGAIVLSKLNLNEFAWSIPSEQDLNPPPRNPWRPEGFAMGSSSGSAVAVASGLCPFALGTDAGGSVRQPAANCGVLGLKPTHGLVPSTAAFGPPSICEVGPIARSIEDLAIVMDAMTHRDVHLDALAGASPRPRVGVLRSYAEDAGAHPDVMAAFEAALGVLAATGAEVRDVRIENLADAAAADFIVLNAEAFALHEATLRAQPQTYGPSARIYQTQGAFLSAADYIAALRVGRMVGENIDLALREHDILVSPVAPLLTAEAGRQAKARPHTGGLAVFTAPFNLTGHPALAMPCGISGLGVPVGLQLIGRRGGEADLLRIGRLYEESTPWSALRPPPIPAPIS